MLAGDKVVFTRDDIDLIAKFAGCSLDEKPGSNWVQDAGGLPQYICEVARAIKKTGKSTSRAIAIAVSRMKVWASGKGVDKDTQAKAAKALAEWEAKRAKSRVKTAAKKAGKSGGDKDKMAASHVVPGGILCLSDTEYNMDSVRNAFDNRMRAARDDWRKANPGKDWYADDGPQRLYVKELWNTFLIAQSDYGDDAQLYKVPYTVTAKGEITFGEATEVKTEYVVVESDDADDSLDDNALKALMATVPACQFSPFLNLTPQPSALERVLKYTGQ